MSKIVKISWLIAVLLSGAVAVQATPEVLAGWWEPSNSVDVQADGISASKDTIGWGEPTHGCGDDTFGSFTGASHNATSPGSYHDKSSNTLSMAFTVSNAGTNGYALNYLSLDTYRSYSDAKDQWSLSVVGGDLGVVSNALSGGITSVSGGPAADEFNDFTDLDINISGLGLVLGVGQSVTLQVDFLDSTPSAIGNLFVDNIAILGTAVTQQVSTAVLAGWWEPSNAVDVTTPGFTAVKTTTGWGAPAQGCSDDTFGSFAGASHNASSPGSFWNNNSTNTLSMLFQVTNGSGSAYELDFLSFDAWRVYSDATDQWSLSIVAGDLGLTNDMASGTIERIAGGPSGDEVDNDFLDIDVSLSGFGLELAAGETVTFELEFSDSTPSAHGNLFVDNIALIGTIVTPQYDSGYAEWADDWTVAIGSETNDYDGDGLVNLGEYALDGIPTNALHTGIPAECNVSGAVMTYVYTVRTDDADLTWHVETSADLTTPGGWTNAGYTAIGTNTADTVFHVITNEVPADADSGFVKLVLEYQ